MSDFAARVQELDALVARMLSATMVPGAAMAVVDATGAVFAKGYGLRDLEAELPMTARTAYPIASTTKSMTATLLGMLVDEGRLGWDVPVRHYLPRFRLRDPHCASLATVRDLLTMRTGLPRHDWVWNENPISRSELAELLVHLEPSAGFRERFQYNNATFTTAAHIAEIVTGESWEQLLQQRIFAPLKMNDTDFSAPTNRESTLSYHENRHRQRCITERRVNEVVGPAGSLVHSTVADMAHWLLFNLRGGRVAEQQLISAQTLDEMHSPQVWVGTDPSAPSPHAAYGLGWFIDTCNGSSRVSHSGYGYDVDSEVTLLPQQGIAVVSLANFGPLRLSSVINKQACDVLMGIQSKQPIEQQVQAYAKRIDETRQRIEKEKRVANTAPSHPLPDYVGTYRHKAYGKFEIRCHDGVLVLHRNRLVLPLEHWHYDAWVATENEIFPIYAPHVFDAASRLLFEMNSDGDIVTVSIRLEPAVEPIRFEKQL